MPRARGVCSVGAFLKLCGRQRIHCSAQHDHHRLRYCRKYMHLRDSVPRDHVPEFLPNLHHHSASSRVVNRSM